MAPFDITQDPSGRYLSFAEREEITILKEKGKGVREIARTIGHDTGTISCELRRNTATRGSWNIGYQSRSGRQTWPKVAKLVANPPLRAYVEDRLSGKITRPNGTVVTGPEPPRFTGRG